MQPSPLPPDEAATPQRYFIEVEKNLISIGFFTPSSSRIMTTDRKSTSIVRYAEGQRVETTVSILPAAYYGLPVTADQDKYFALQKIMQGLKQRIGVIPNPIGFTSAEMLRILNLKKSGKNYDEVTEWMKRMTATTISAAIYLAGRKVWVEDTFHVFDRAVGKGMEVSEGRLADMNYVWLSPWQRENLESSYQVPIDFEAYCRLRNHIAKALVPLLQVWLFSSMHAGRFEKSYADLCQLLNIRRYEHISKIREVLRPSLDELTEMGYISSWEIEPRVSGDDYKISLVHGEKFFADRELRQARDKGSAGLVEELVTRGISDAVARQLVAQSPEEQTIRDQLEWGDFLIRTSRGGRFHNPAGFYVYLLRNRVLPPRDFETSRVRLLREAEAAKSAGEGLRRLEVENEYAEYRVKQIEEARAMKYPGDDALTAKLAQIETEIRAETPDAQYWVPARLETLARQRLDAEIAQEIPLLSFEEFVTRQASQFRLF